MPNEILFYILFGTYGYVRFTSIIWKGKRAVKNNIINTNSPKIEISDFLDFVIGLISIVVALVYLINSHNNFLIILFYGISLILKSLRRPLKIAQKSIAYRKIFNYAANLYIIISIWMLGFILESFKVSMAYGWVIILYFGTYFLIWR
ncbi:hypothetical protein JCM16816_04780 [Thermoanaerobacter brockii subsp. lactiethylicus]